jgi:predicted DCC family thiol-disulfide oxidoreductase YuxK
MHAPHRVGSPIGRDLLSGVEASVTPVFPVEIFYDGSCALCRASRRWVERRDALGRFRFVDSGGLTAAETCPVPRGQLDRAVWVRLPDGALASGYDALLATVAALPRGRFLAVLAGLGPLRKVGAMLYSTVARHRHALPARGVGAASARRPP